MAAVPEGGSNDKPGSQGGGAVDGLTPPTMKYADAQKTQIGPPQTMGQAPSISNKQQQANKGLTSSSFGGATNTETVVSDVAVQDLSSEKLLRDAPRMESNGHTVPSLNGIPMLAKLGQGGMGAVYYGIHPRLRSEVAVKVLPFHLAEQDPGMIRRFFREAQIAAQVRSPHLVNVMDVNEEAGLFFLVMEFVPGVTAGQFLKALLEKGQPGMAEADALDVIIAATEGLLAAHKQGVVHRDLKPDNIMVPYLNRTEKNFDLKRAKLMDLGLARTEESNQSLTGAQAAMGTPGYMAPEQAMDAKTADKRSDVFGMGATLYALLAGRPPFRGEAIMKVLMATMHEPHEPITKHRAEISAPLSELIDRCLDKKQENRYQDANQLLRALRNCRRLLSAGGTVIAPEAADDDDDDGAPAVGVVPGGSGAAKTISGNARTVTGAPKTISGSARTVTNADDLEATLVGPGAAGAAGAARSAQLTPPPAKSNMGMLIGIGVAVLALGGGGAFYALGNKPGNTDGKGGGQQTNTKQPAIDPKALEKLQGYLNTQFAAAQDAFKGFKEFELGIAIESIEAQVGKLPPEELKKLQPRIDETKALAGLLTKRIAFRNKFEQVETLYSSRNYEQARTDAVKLKADAPSPEEEAQVNGLIKKIGDRTRLNKALVEAETAGINKAAVAQKALNEVATLASDETEKKKIEELTKKLQRYIDYSALLTTMKELEAKNSIKEALAKAVEAAALLPEREGDEARDAKLRLTPLLDKADQAKAEEEKRDRFRKAFEGSQIAMQGSKFEEAERLAAVAVGDAYDETSKKSAESYLESIRARIKVEAETKKRNAFTQLMQDAEQLLKTEKSIATVSGKIADAKALFPEDPALKALDDSLAAYNKALAAAETALAAKPNADVAGAQKAVNDAMLVLPNSARAATLTIQIDTVKKSIREAEVAGRETQFKKLVGDADRLAEGADFAATRTAYEAALKFADVFEDAAKRKETISAKMKQVNEREVQAKAEIAYNNEFKDSLQHLKPGNMKAAGTAIDSLHARHAHRNELKTAGNVLKAIGEMEDKFAEANARVAKVKDKLKKDPSELKDLNKAYERFQNAVTRLTTAGYKNSIALADALRDFKEGVQLSDIEEWVKKIENDAEKQSKPDKPPVSNPGELDPFEESKKKPEKKPDEKGKTPKPPPKAGELDPFDQ